MAPGARAPPNPPAEAPPNTQEGQAPQTATVGQHMPQCPCPSAPGAKTCPQVGEVASSGEMTHAPPNREQHKQARGQHPSPNHHHTHLHITYIRTCPPSLNSAGVWRSGHTRGPAAPQPPQTPNQQNKSSSWPLPPWAATRQQGCGKTPPLAPLALQYFLIVSD